MIESFGNYYFSTDDASWQDLRFRHTQLRLACIPRTHKDDRQRTAYEWANDVASDLHLPTVLTWKSFKRDLAAKWFGSPERSVFRATWRDADVINYAERFAAHSVRISIFPSGKACRSYSRRLPASRSARTALLKTFDHSSDVEVFPESSSSTTICFRRYSCAFGHTVVFEAGLGQATLVFEEEQGKYPIVGASRIPGEGYEVDLGGRFTLQEQLIASRLQRLLGAHSTRFEAATSTLCRAAGIPWVAIEGYFDDGTLKTTVVDLDLPFDEVFF